MEDKRFALLIDADNISSKYIGGIMDEMTKHGVVTYKRIYGDWTSSQAGKWKEQLLLNSVTPIQQFSNTTGKNATDSALIIDAMDILYTHNVDGFCIVSSDSDFTRLASRLRESGMVVVGMGEEKTPRSFRAACTLFTNLELLIDQDEDFTSAPKAAAAKKTVKKGKPSKSGEVAEIAETEVPEIVDSEATSGENNLSVEIVEDYVISIINENKNKDRVTGIGEIGSRLVNKHPDFDVRNYGYSLLSKFLEESLGFEVKKENKTITVSMKESDSSKDEIILLMEALISAGGEKGVGLNELSNELHSKYPKFNVKDYGYSQFSKFVQNVQGVDYYEFYEDSLKRKRVRKRS